LVMEWEKGKKGDWKNTRMHKAKNALSLSSLSVAQIRVSNDYPR
jgi:hypothetical protein